MAGDDDDKKGHVDPAEEGELLTKVLSLKIGNKGHEAKYVKHEADKPVVPGKRK